ncbi:MAG: hypothetical protein [Vetruanivirus porcinprimi]|uniref:Peptidase n=1 Tax=phage Lak_Megaphage_RVC_AP1_GC26 TaxID=3109224 RepID=A0ABZ0Z873_9CAUD|nr:MAG: hypothetical protein [phage Lak_Megaphage_RVC_AP1_GC26]
MYLRKSYLYNSIIKDVSYSLKQILDETLGSLYLNDKEKSIVDKIFNDIDTEKYKNNKLSYKDYQQIANSSDNLYNLQYDNILPWLEHLEIIIIENDSYNSTNAAALLDYDNYTTFSNEKIIYATIVIINPKRERFTKNKITHELNHYYSEFNRYKTTSIFNVYGDLELNIKLSNSQIDFTNYEYIQDNLTNFGFIRQVFLDCLYWLNESEIKAHIEDIYSEIHDNVQNNLNCKNISDITELSQTLKTYYNIDKILHFYKDNLDDMQNKMLQKALLNKVKTIYNRNRMSLNQIYSKLFNKIKKIYKHVNRLYAYNKNEYVNNYGK